MSKIMQGRIQDIVKDSYMQYGQYVIINRAIPSLYDGMKPVYRRVLYALHKHKCTSFTKSATCVGYVFPFHPHGSTYGTMVGLVQSDNLLTPLLDGKGNFGQHTSRDLAPAAERYSEIKLSEMTKDIFSDLNKEIVNWIPNYDNTQTMPEFLPVKFPMILHIAQEGVAVGMSNKMPSFSINDICNAMIDYIDNEKETILIPDFPTGANIINDNEVFNNINFNGNGTIRIRAKARIIESTKTIIIDEIPYSTTREKVIETIVEKIQAGKIRGIKNVHDITGLKSFGIRIDCKRDANLDLILEQLYKMTTLEDTYSCNMNVLYNGLPQVMGVWPIIKEWLKWRHSCLISYKEGENARLKNDLEVYTGLVKIVDNIDGLIKIIRFTDDALLLDTVMNKFDLTYNQAEYLINMKIRNINKDYIQKRIKTIDDLRKEINKNNEFINSEDIRNDYIKNDLRYIMNKFGKPRKSDIIDVDATKVKKILEKVPTEKKNNNKDVKVIITNENYIKKIDINDNKETNLKAGDSVKHIFETKETGEILIFVGRDCYKIYVDDLKLSKSSELGEYIPNIIGHKDIIGYSIMDDKYKFHIIHYSNDKIAKISTSSFRTNMRRRRLTNSLCDIADTISITPLREDTNIKLINNEGKEKIINTSHIDLKTSRGARGASYWRNIREIKIK